MADKGIIFSAPMVRALLDGRKTQTRRLCAWANNPLSPALSFIVACDEPGWFGDEEGEVQFKAGYAPGDRLYVRENWQALSFGDYLPTKSHPADVRYAATDPCADLPADTRGYPWRPSIHMPRWASRLWLDVTNVRVERLQEIGEADAIAEGRPEGPLGRIGAVAWYRDLWNTLHAEPGTRWEDNPWIVAVSFDVRRGNIDHVPA